jgi:hypothetical protein
MSLAVIVSVTVLVFVMLGYQLNRNDGKIEQGGLVQFDSRPTGASVTVDGTSFGTRTPSKTTMTAGQHFVTMGRTGYKTWQKSISVLPGSVLWLNYTRLIPNDLKTSNVASFPSVSSTSVSPDSKWMAIEDDAASPAIHLADLSQDIVKTTQVVLPAVSYTHPSEGKTQSFTLVTWDPDSRYILVKHVYDDIKTEWLVVDSKDVSLTKNVTTLLDINASKVIFSGENSHTLYAQIDTDVRKIDLGAATISRPIITNVAEFGLYDRSTITYTTVLNPDTKMRSVGYYDDGAEKPYVIRNFSDDGVTPLHVAFGKYFGDMYEAISYGDTTEVLKGDLPTDTKPFTFRVISKMNVLGGAQHLSIVTEGRFVVAQNGGTYQVYDLELKKATTTILKGSTNVTQELPWLDNYMLWSDRDNMLRLYEFDGTNQHDIMPVAAGFSATLSPNSKYLYGIVKSSDGVYHLERVRMIIS